MDPIRGVKVVCMGGGTGLSSLLTGLKRLSLAPSGGRGTVALEDLTAIVTVSDDGGSSGRLRDQFRTPAPGDVRNCLVALASDESLMTELFRYRFRGDGELHDHSLGNLFLTALADITGDFHRAVQLSSHILAVAGRILPSTVEDATLKAELVDGRVISGETAITATPGRIQRVYLEPACHALPEALEAIAEADIVTLGPGSLFTSLIPNLLQPEILEALEASQAFKLYIGNIMTQPCETSGFALSDHLEALRLHGAGKDLFPEVLVNSSPIPAAMEAHYLEAGARPVPCTDDRVHEFGVRVRRRPLLMEGTTARHEPELLAEAILELYEERRQP